MIRYKLGNHSQLRSLVKSNLKCITIKAPNLSGCWLIVPAPTLPRTRNKRGFPYRHLYGPHNKASLSLEPGR